LRGTKGEQRNVRLGAQRQRSIGFLCRLEGQTNILLHQVDRKATRVAACGRHVGHDTRHGVVLLWGPALSRWRVDNRGQDLGIHAQFNAQVEALGYTGHGNGQDQIVAHFGHLSVANVTTMHNVFAHTLEEDFGPIKVGNGRTNHESQGTRFGALSTRISD
jgi:hypothetical protein